MRRSLLRRSLLRRSRSPSCTRTPIRKTRRSREMMTMPKARVLVGRRPNSAAGLRLAWRAATRLVVVIGTVFALTGVTSALAADLEDGPNAGPGYGPNYGLGYRPGYGPGYRPD